MRINRAPQVVPIEKPSERFGAMPAIPYVVQNQPPHVVQHEPLHMVRMNHNIWHKPAAVCAV